METRSIHSRVPLATLILILANAIFASSETLQLPQQTVQIRSDLQHATEFVRTLQHVGIRVQEVLGSKLAALFQGVDTSAFVRTDLGVVELVVLPGAKDAEKISITYTRGGALHQYTLKGPFLPVEGERMDTADPSYFTLHKNWFLVTREPELEGQLKRALGQTSRQATP